MSERLMKNFPIEFEGNAYWRSRSCTVVGFVFCFDKDNYVNILVNQRGPGAPTNVGKWNVPCGYIGFIEECGDVDGEHAVVRETFEETGIKIAPERFHFDSVTFSKNDEQNINLRYWAKLDGTIDDYPVSNAANEPGETSDIRWVRVKDVDKYDWAFGHEKAIPEMCRKHVEFYLDDNGVQCDNMFLVNLDIITLENSKTVSSEILTVCDTREKCKEYTKSHIQMMERILSKSGTTHDPFNFSDFDAVVKWHDGDKSSISWYTFIPVKKYG